MSDLDIPKYLRVRAARAREEHLHFDARVYGEAANEIEQLEKDRISLAGALRTIRDSTAKVDSLSWQTADEALGQLGPGDTDA